MLNFQSFQLRNFSIYKHWPWLLVMPMSILGLCLALVLLPTLKIENKNIEGKVASQVAALLEVQSNQPINRSSNVVASLANFDRIAVIVSDMQEIARSNGLTLPDATYQPETNKVKSEISRVSITTHVKGSYPAIKKFIAELMASHEGLALTSVSIQRTRSTDLINETELHLTFYYRKAT